MVKRFILRFQVMGDPNLLSKDLFNLLTMIVDEESRCVQIFSVNSPGICRKSIPAAAFNIPLSKVLGLICWVLWHINLCRLFNTKSIFM